MNMSEMAHAVDLCSPNHLVDGEGWQSKEHRCKVDWAEQIKQLVDEDYPDVDKIILESTLKSPD